MTMPDVSAAFPKRPELAAAVFDILNDVAAKGGRCPTYFDFDRYLSARGHPYLGTGAIVTSLARHGFVKVELYGKNWRVVEIAAGPNAGKRTAMHPTRCANEPYRVIEAGA